MQRVVLVVALALLAISSASPEANAQSSDETAAPASQDDTVVSMRDSIQLALKFLEDEGNAWMEKRKCVSCHQVPSMVWGLSAAANHGFEVSPTRLERYWKWATDWRHFSAPARKDTPEDQALSGNIDTMYQLILAAQHTGHGIASTDAVATDSADSDSESAEPTPAWNDQFIAALLTEHQDDGSWKACGQLPTQKRPNRETTEVTTLWTLLTFEQAHLADDARWLQHRQKATAWLNGSDHAEPVSTEWWAVRLLLARQQNETAMVQTARNQLRKHQHEDGGWGWLLAEPSDAYGTGLAMYALAAVAETADEDAFRRAGQFLLKSQRVDGSWPVPSTKKVKKNGIEPTAVYWGTSWAVLGLLESGAVESKPQAALTK